MTRKIVSIEPDAGVGDVAKAMAKNGVHRLPVIADGEVMGIVTSTDVARYFAENLKGTVSAGELAREVPTLREFHTVFKAAKLMNAKNEKRIVITRDNKPSGIITERDISMASFGMKPAEMVMVRKKGNGMTHHHMRMYPLIIGDLMKADLQTIQAKDDAGKAAARMLEKKIGSLLVYDKDKYVGLISKGDFVDYLAKK
jgi:CBS domain-containing protein